MQLHNKRSFSFLAIYIVYLQIIYVPIILEDKGTTIKIKSRTKKNIDYILQNKNKKQTNNYITH